ncbi:hypothetical protein FIBSPDRAFT_889988 [Athelia psychrophila]|uniref:CxC5 like cysteine cluster associated with KDZ domain-containing protein n=1 Tax=Athelia psychrophila TaxID=1759441 RepID=A0A166LED4_9AGAM|nr:hypothetical protein FIBSPDRAFT_889988 [Fibularhizoctonia sp. CBS 109695]
MPTVQDLIIVLQTLFPADLDLKRTLFALAAITTVYPLLLLHRNQLAGQHRQGAETGWMTAIWAVIYSAFHPELADPDLWNDEGPGADAAQQIYEYIGDICNLFGAGPLFTDPKYLLITRHTICIFCSQEDPSNILHKKGKGWVIKLIGTDFKICSAQLVVGACRKCGARYYPDHITYQLGGVHLQKLEWDPEYLRISKHGVWAIRQLAVSQEKAIYHLHASFFNFTHWLNSTNGTPTLTIRQSQKLFMEHFSHRLISAHNMEDTFFCPADPSTNTLAQSVCCGFRKVFVTNP